MSAVAKTKRMTVEEFLDLHDEVRREELVRGEAIEVTPAGRQSSYVAIRVATRLATYAEAHRLGAVMGADAGYVIARDPDTVRAPDVSFVSKERLAEEEDPDRFFPGAPDLAVEVVSATDRVRDVEQKCLEYLAAGAKLVWLVFPETRRIHVYRSPKEVEVLTDEDMLTAEPVIPGFSCPVAEIFAE